MATTQNKLNIPVEVVSISLLLHRHEQGPKEVARTSHVSSHQQPEMANIFAPVGLMGKGDADCVVK